MTAATAAAAKRALRRYADPVRAKHALRFFKTGPGEYGAGDRFIGAKVPEIRLVCREFRTLPLAEVRKLLKSAVHEERLLAVFILVWQFKRGDPAQQENVYRFYVRHMKHINNWDLVDSSAPYIVGGYLFEQDRKELYTWAKSRNLWKRRIAVMGTFYFIREDDFDDALRLSKLLLRDEHDLIHKAVGWMLREIGNRNRRVEEAFLKKHYPKMPRTMLRYAIEKFPEKRRRAYIEGRV